MSISTPTATAVATSTAPLEAEQKKPLWEKRLTKIFWINSVAISKDGKRVVAGTFIHDYDQKLTKGFPNVQSRFGVYFFDDVLNPTARVEPKWSHEFDAWDGVYGVAISADGKIVAASGWLDKNQAAGTKLGLLRAYDADSTTTEKIAPLLDFTGITQRVSWVSLSDDGGVLAAVADDVYVFLREKGGAFNPTPLKLGVAEVANRYVTGIAVHPSGTWVAACDNTGHVHVATIKNGAIGSQVTWTAEKQFPFLSVAIARNVDKFMVGGGNLVFLFDLAGLMTNPKSYQPLAFDTAKDEPEGTVPRDKDDGRLQENVRWVAISADGRFMTTVVNRLDDKKLAGKLIALTPELTHLWHVKINNNPNSTSIDDAGRFVTMADGWPTSRPAKFHLFDSTGKKLWEMGTCSMNWPMVINTDGTAIVAGSDDGGVYYFTP